LIKEGALDMIKSYLKGRTFSVAINDILSTPHLLKYGVPQGSILGPLFYLLYTKEIEDIIQNHGLKAHIYADDCSVYVPFVPQKQQNVEEQFKRCFCDLQNWMKSSFLKLNSDKTMLKVFKPNSINQEAVSFNIKSNENVVIEPSETVKLLGVTLGSKLTFSDFVSKKIQNCNFQLRNLRAIGNSLPYNAKVILVTNMIFSNIDYCNAILICSPQYLILKLQRTVNRAVRFIFNAKRTDHITPLLFRLHILPVMFRIRYKVSLFAFKIVHKIAPQYLINKVQMFEATGNCTLRTGHGRDALMFKITVNQCKNKTWIVHMIQEWNALPFSLRSLVSLLVFKAKLKSHYFKLAFPDYC
jgi:hypothetical protein